MAGLGGEAAVVVAAALIDARSALLSARHVRRVLSYRLSGIIEVPAVVKPMATSPESKRDRNSTSNRYGNRNRRNSEERV